MLSDKEIANLESFYCNEHKIYKVKDHTTGTYNCLDCLHENSNVTIVRHKTFSNLSKIKPVYFFLVFSLIYSLITFIFDLLIVLISFSNVNVNANFIFIIKVISSGFLTYFYDKNIIVRK